MESSTLRRAGLFALPLTVVALLAPAGEASAQLLPKLNPLAAIGNHPYGCQWIESIDAKNRNTGYPDAFAQYETGVAPVYLPASTGVITISGKYPKARYFNFTSYDGFRPGNLIDAIQDYQLTPRLAGAPVGTPAGQPAPLPDSGGHTYDWRLKLKYEFPPTPPLARDPDTLYMGDQNTHYLGATFPDAFGSKQVGYRVYLPDVGADEFGDVDLPQITYTAADGTVIDVSHDNPDQKGCDQAAKSQDLVLLVFPQAAVSSSKNTQFDIADGFQTIRFYANGGSNYARATTNVMYADMVVVRFKAPPTPNLTVDPKVRYYSLCQNQYDNTAVVACLSDRDFLVQPDGYVVGVISPLAKRPAKANAANGYNLLPWGPAAQTIVYLRQILANPAFEGNFVHAAGKGGAELPPILGDWAPQATYCDSQTFDAYAEQGGAALVAACQANYKPFKNGIGKADPR